MSDVYDGNKVTIHNVAMVLADTEYSLVLTGKRITFTLRDGDVGDNYRLAYTTGKVDTPTEPYIKRNGNVEYEDKCAKFRGKTLYFASSAASQVAEIVEWS